MVTIQMHQPGKSLLTAKIALNPQNLVCFNSLLKYRLSHRYNQKMILALILKKNFIDYLSSLSK